MLPKQIDRLDVVIADPDPESVSVFERLCSSITGLNLSGVARSAQMLIAKTKNVLPDLVFLSLSGDIGGPAVIDTLKKIHPDLNVIVLYGPDHDPDILVQALEAGAYECIERPAAADPLKYETFRIHLLAVTGLLRSRKRFFGKGKADYKNKFFMPVHGDKVSGVVPKSDPVPDMKTGQLPDLRTDFKSRQGVDVVAIAASTGGPEILSRIFSILPRNLNVPILLVQHIPENMTVFFAKSLNRKSELDITQAKEGDSVVPSRIYVAPGGCHMTVSKPDPGGTRLIRITKKPLVNSVRPSADVLFESIADAYCGGNVLAIILTGMGEDGRHGIACLKKKTHCICISQDAHTCVVYGMPRAVDEAGLSDESLDPLSITQRIVMSA